MAKPRKNNVARPLFRQNRQTRSDKTGATYKTVESNKI